MSFFPSQDSGSSPSPAESSSDHVFGEGIAQRPGVGLSPPMGDPPRSPGLSSPTVRGSKVPQKGGF